MFRLRFGLQDTMLRTAKYASNLLDGRGKIYSRREYGMGEAAFDLGTMYEAGTDITLTTWEAFVLAAMLNLSVMRKAQRGLDEAVSPDALPSFDTSRCSHIFTLLSMRSCNGDRLLLAVCLMQ
jgi:hypothetical protein